MRISLTASVFLFLRLLNPVNMSFSAHPLDLEGSGYDLDSSGSGDWSEQGEIKTIQDNSRNQDVRTFAANAGGGNEDIFHGSSVLTSDSTYWPAKDSTSGLVVVANSKSLLERNEVFTVVIAGGVTGVALAAALTAVLIYKWQKKDDEGYTLGQQRALD